MDLVEAKKLLSAGRTQSTAEAYIYSFRRVAKGVYGISGDELLQDVAKIRDYDKIIKFIWKKIPVKTRNSILTGFYHVATLVVRTKDMKKYKDELITIRKVGNAATITDNHSKHSKTQENFEWNDLIEKRNEYKFQLTDYYNPKVDISYLLLALYSMLPPLRPQDYVKTRVFKNAANVSDNILKSINFIDITTSKLVINYHKTFEAHSKKIIKIPRELLKIIKNFKNKSKSRWLVPTLRNNMLHMGPKQFNHFFVRIFDKTEKIKIGPSFLRTYYISMRLDDKNVTDSDRELDAEIMGHNPSTADLYYSKLSKKTSHRRSSGSKTAKKPSKKSKNKK